MINELLCSFSFRQMSGVMGSMGLPFPQIQAPRQRNQRLTQPVYALEAPSVSEDITVRRAASFDAFRMLTFVLLRLCMQVQRTPQPLALMAPQPQQPQQPQQQQQQQQDVEEEDTDATLDAPYGLAAFPPTGAYSQQQRILQQQVTAAAASTAALQSMFNPTAGARGRPTVQQRTQQQQSAQMLHQHFMPPPASRYPYQ